jgi:hypothetical protein
VFRVCVASCRREPVRIQGFAYLFFLHSALPVLSGFYAEAARGIKPGVPVFTTLLSLCLV